MATANLRAQAIGVVNAACHPPTAPDGGGRLALAVAANCAPSGSGPRFRYGFSCMGYEIAGGGAADRASEVEPDRDTIVVVGRGSYLLC